MSVVVDEYNECKRCGHKWYSREVGVIPVVCSRCKSFKWQEEKRQRLLLLSPRSKAVTTIPKNPLPTTTAAEQPLSIDRILGLDGQPTLENYETGDPDNRYDEDKARADLLSGILDKGSRTLCVIGAYLDKRKNDDRMASWSPELRASLASGGVPGNAVDPESFVIEREEGRDVEITIKGIRQQHGN